MTEKEFEELISPGALEFLSEHKHDDPQKFALKFSGRKDIPVRAISEQVYCYKKALSKIPLLAERSILFEKTALEQSSGEIAAAFKAGILKGKNIIDLSGGLGIDDIFISQNFQNLYYCELDPVRLKLFQYNVKLLNINNICIKAGNSIDTLISFPDNFFDWIYVDPSRRNEDKRFVGLQNCSPDVVKYQELLLKKSENLLIKASPALELEEVKKQIPSLREFIVLSVNNECKETLLLVSKTNIKQDLLIKAVCLNSESLRMNNFEISSFYPSETNRPQVSDAKKYFYEPDAAIIKARLSQKLSLKYSLSFINSSVDYLTSDSLVEEFPGRVFVIERVLPYKKQLIKKFLRDNSITKANIQRRDFPDTPDVIKKNFDLKDGGNIYLFFTKNRSGEFITLFCRKAF